MHTPVPDVDEALEIVKRHWDGPIGICPESAFYLPATLTIADRRISGLNQVGDNLTLPESSVFTVPDNQNRV